MFTAQETVASKEQELSKVIEKESAISALYADEKKDWDNEKLQLSEEITSLQVRNVLECSLYGWVPIMQLSMTQGLTRHFTFDLAGEAWGKEQEWRQAGIGLGAGQEQASKLSQAGKGSLGDRKERISGSNCLIQGQSDQSQCPA